MPALVAVVVGVLLGFAIGGSLRSLSHLSLRWEWLVLLLFVVQAVARGRLMGALSATRLSLPVWTVASVVLIAVMLLNSDTPGMLLGAVGILMNVNVVLLNAGMPVVVDKRASVLASVASAMEIAKSTGGFYRVAMQGDLLEMLGDSIPVTWGSAVLLLSPGDVVLMVAVIVVIVFGMTQVERPRFLSESPRH